MARRPKRIDFNAIEDTTHPEHKRHRDAMIDDLLRKFPRGPECKLTREDYVESYYDIYLEPEKVPTGGNREGCGYTRMQLYILNASLNCDGSEWTWRQKLWNIYPALGRAGYTRRSRRLERRTSRSVQSVMESGLPGIYRVTFDGSGRRHPVHIWAESPAMAEMVAKTSVGPSYGDISWTHVQFVRKGGAHELMGLNTKTQDRISNETEGMKKEIAKLQAKLEMFELRSAMIDMYSINAVAG